MPSVFTMIINGDLPAHFVYRDDLCVAFMSIEPLTTGHTLVVPIQEVDHWIDLDGDTLAHLTEVSRRIGRAINDAFLPSRVGVMIVGDEVPHVHIHLVPIDSAADLSFTNAKPASHEALAEAASTIQSHLNR